MQSGARRLAAELGRTPLPQGLQISWNEQATVDTVTPGGAADGSALALVTWRGQAGIPAAYLASYTPTVGHVVAVSVQPPGGLTILGRVIGTPPS